MEILVWIQKISCQRCLLCFFILPNSTREFPNSVLSSVFHHNVSCYEQWANDPNFLRGEGHVHQREEWWIVQPSPLPRLLSAHKLYDALLLQHPLLPHLLPHFWTETRLWFVFLFKMIDYYFLVNFWWIGYYLFYLISSFFGTLTGFLLASLMASISPSPPIAISRYVPLAFLSLGFSGLNISHSSSSFFHQIFGVNRFHSQTSIPQLLLIFHVFSLICQVELRNFNKSKQWDDDHCIFNQNLPYF